MSSKLPMSQGRRTPLSLSAQPKQQAQQGNKRPSNSNNKAEQNRHQQQQQQQYQAKEDKRETIDITANNTNLTAAAAVAAKEVQNTSAMNNGSNVVVGNGSNVVANGNNKAAAGNAAINTQDAPNEKKETRNRAVKQQQQQNQQQPTKSDGQQMLKNVAKTGADSAAKNASQRKQQQQAQQQQMQQQPKQAQQQQPQIQQQPAKEQPQVVIEPEVVTPSAPTQKPLEEKLTVIKQQKPQNENVSSITLVEDESTSKQTENAPAIDTKAVAEKKEPETRTPSAKDEKLVDIQKKNDSQQINEEKSVKAATPTKPAETITVSPKKLEVIKHYSPSQIVKHSVTSCIDADDNGDEMILRVSPTKKSNQHIMAAPQVMNDNPNATSTPGKSIRVFEMHTPEQRGHGEPLRNLMISGRRSIRPITDWTPSQYENNPQFRGSYRRIKTDLDNSMDTNTSLNVTVGSEPADNNSSWFSFRSRKRERTPTNIEMVKEAMMSPPKRARFGGLFSVMASPLTALRTRFSKASITNNAVEKLSPEKSVEVEDDVNSNMSLEHTVDEDSKVENISPEVEENEVKNESPQKVEIAAEEEKSATASNEKLSPLEEGVVDDIAITETVATKKSCNVM